MKDEHDENKACSSHSCGLCCTKIENFTVVFGKTKVLDNVDIHIHCGELTAVIGPNGAGKSTLLKAILGEVEHLGELKFLDAKGIRTNSPLIGYVPQHMDFDLGTPTSVADIFAASRTKIPSWLYIPSNIRKGIIKSLEAVKAQHLIDRRLGELSGGELQRVLLALALDPIPDLLLLDEPVSGIDQSGLDLFYEIVSQIRQKFDLSIILVSHDLDLVSKYADRVILINKTVLCNGTPDEVFSNEKALDVFGLTWYKNIVDKGEKNA